MTVTQVVGCMGMITGGFLLCGVRLTDFSEGIFAGLLHRHKGIREEIREETQRKKKSYFRKELQEVEENLRLTGKEKTFSLLLTVCLVGFMAGAGLAIGIGNVFLVPVMAVGLLFVPLWYVKMTSHHMKKIIAQELETALSIITTAYLRNEDIVTAVQENLEYLNPPVQNVFREFLSRIQLVDPEVGAAIRELKGKIANDVFEEWCDGIAACQFDRSLKMTLPPIVGKLSDVRIVNGELELLATEPRKEFFTMVALTIGNIPLLYFLNRDWYHALMDTLPGKMMLAGTAGIIFFCMAKVIQLTKPMEYRN